MAIDAFSLPSVLGAETLPAQNVLLPRFRFKMIGIDALPISALVVKRHTIRDLVSRKQI